MKGNELKLKEIEASHTSTYRTSFLQFFSPLFFFLHVRQKEWGTATKNKWLRW